ncbi:MAG: cytochrome-c oxidase, cbb3-type subunit III [Alphaproteobacteria bacterium]
MADNNEPPIDAHTGVRTTGHEWDGIRELNQPLPRWWLWIFYATIVWALGYWVLYPSWPLISSNTEGVLGWHARTAVLDDLSELQALRGPMVSRLTETEIGAVKDDAQLQDFTMAYGRAAFGDNCAPCHGVGAGGAVGYPNLIDDDWIWGGDIDSIRQTIAYGVGNDHPDTRIGQMPAFGRDEILTSGEIANVASFVRSLSALEAANGTDVDAGATIFAENCADCHGETAGGNRDFGAPNLADAIWLFGSSHTIIAETVNSGRQGAMPAWEERLGATTVKALAFYVHSLGGGE